MLTEYGYGGLASDRKVVEVLKRLEGVAYHHPDNLDVRALANLLESRIGLISSYPDTPATSPTDLLLMVNRAMELFWYNNETPEFARYMLVGWGLIEQVRLPEVRIAFIVLAAYYYLYVGLLEDSLSMARMAITEANSNELWLHSAAAHVIAARAYLAQNDYEQTRRLLTDGLATAKLAGSNEMIFESHMQTCVLEHLDNNASEAHNSLEMARAVSHIVYDPNAPTRIRVVEALIIQPVQISITQIELFERSIEILEKAGDPVTFILMLMRLARSYSHYYNPDRAIEISRMAVSIARRTSQTEMLCASLLCHGEVLKANSYLHEAIGTLTMSVQQSMDLGFVAIQARSRLVKARAMVDLAERLLRHTDSVKSRSAAGLIEASIEEYSITALLNTGPDREPATDEIELGIVDTLLRFYNHPAVKRHIDIQILLEKVENSVPNWRKFRFGSINGNLTEWAEGQFKRIAADCSPLDEGMLSSSYSALAKLVGYWEGN